MGGDIIVNNLPFRDSQPSVAMDTVGEFVVTWTRRLPSGDLNVQAARFSNTGVNLGGFNSSITVAGSGVREYDSSVAVNRIGDFVVSYTVDTAAANQDIFARRFTDAGVFLGTIPVATSVLARETRSSAARILDGRFAIAYQVDPLVLGNSNVVLRRYSPVGAPARGQHHRGHAGSGVVAERLHG